MPKLRNGSKGGFEPGLSRLRVRLSTAELSNSTTNIKIPFNTKVHNIEKRGHCRRCDFSRCSLASGHIERLFEVYEVVADLPQGFYHFCNTE